MIGPEDPDDDDGCEHGDYSAESDADSPDTDAGGDGGGDNGSASSGD